MVGTQDISVPDGSVPFGLAYALATALETVWWGTSKPPITRQELVLFGREMTVNDARARRELGYTGAVGVEEGLRELREDFLAQQPQQQPVAQQ